MTKTERTRLSLTRAALELFEQRGYPATSVAAIAERAGVTEMTFFRHFPSKDAVLFSDPFDPLIAGAIERQPADLSPLAAVLAGVGEAWGATPPGTSAGVRARLRIISRTPSLRGAIARNTARSEQTMADALRHRGVTRTHARIAAAATMAALGAALLDWADGDDADLGTAISTARDVLGGGSS